MYNATKSNMTEDNPWELSFNSTVECEDIFCVFSPAERYAIICATALVFIVSLIGNSLIIFLIIRDPTMKNSTNISNLNLAISDLLMALFCMPTITIDLYITNGWIFGDFMCKFVSYIQNTAVTATVLNLAAIGIQQFLAVCYPLSFRTKKDYRKYTNISTAVVWALSCTENTVYFVVKRVDAFGDDVFCREVWAEDIHMVVYIIAHHVLMYFIPMTIMFILYFCSIKKLTGKIKHRYCNETDDDGNTNTQKRRTTRYLRHKMQAVKLLVAIVILMFLCWTPYHWLLLVVLMIPNENVDFKALNIAYPVCIWLLYLNTSLHPLLYGFMSEKYRHAFNNTIGKWKIIRSFRKPSDESRRTHISNCSGASPDLREERLNGTPTGAPYHSDLHTIDIM